MPEKKPKKSYKLDLPGDDKVVTIIVRGKTASNWRELLRQEGGIERHHSLSALEDYIKAKGYDGR